MLKIIHKVVGHHMYVVNILVCGRYHNVQYLIVWMCVEKIHKVVGDITCTS